MNIDKSGQNHITSLMEAAPVLGMQKNDTNIILSYFLFKETWL